MVILETSVFTRRITEYLTDEEYRALQNLLVTHPKAGPVIKQSGGARKLRFSYRNLGKSKSLRVIYYFKEADAKLLMLFAYAKNETSDLTPDQVKALRQIIRSF